MTRKLRKAVAFLLIAVLFVQQCSVVSLAEEGEAVEEQEEVPEEELPEPEVTEPEPSETPAPETPAPETPATEPQMTEAPVPETQAPETAAPETQAAETQADTAESEEKAETEAEPESETETESESETERSDRENTGDPVTGSDLAAMLSLALPYLFVTKDLSFPADKEESSIPGDWILDGDDGSGVVSDLKSTSTILANATSSFDVTVINLYADENGSLDTAQLDAIFPDHVIDVTNTYYLVNVIADFQTQELSFSGFAMKEDGETLAYTEETQPGAVLYNFAAYDETSYQDYTGILHLPGGFQGTVLAPAASVRVEGDLSGAAYADQLKVTDVTADLMKIVFYEGAEEETETESETEEIQTEDSAETDTETETELAIVPLTEPTGIDKVTLTAKLRYNGVELTAVEAVSYQIVFYTNEELSDGDPQTEPVSFTEGEKTSENITLQNLVEGPYYAILQDMNGNNLTDITEVPLAEESVVFDLKDYPEGLFSFEKDVEIALNVLDQNGKSLSTDETFYAMIFSEKSCEIEKAILEDTIKFNMDGKSSKTSEEITLTLSSESQTFYLAETDKSGNLIGENEFAYIPTYASTDKTDYGKFTITCGEDPASPVDTITNKLNDTVVKLSIIDEDTGKILSDATFIIVQKEKDGTLKKVAGIYSGSKTLTNSSKLEKDGETTYYLYEINAPYGYTPSPSVSFTVRENFTTEVVIKNSEIITSKYDLTVSKSAYVENIPVYAYGTTDPVYFALFSNSSHTKKVSNVQKLTMSGYTGTLTFSNLENGETYYVAETDEYGIALSSTNSHQIEYTNGTTGKKASSGRMEITKTSQTMAVKNIYTSLPTGYRYAVNLTIKKNVTDSSGNSPLAVSETFYAGLFQKADYSDSPIIIPLSCNNSSSASASRRVLLSGEDSVTYYIAEVDAYGNRITDSSDFAYYPSDPQTVTLTKEDAKNGKSVAMTNRAKNSKVTLTLSKCVYEGSDRLPVDETFYIGLFKDANLTTLYTSPIAMNLSDADRMTLKLTLNIGNKSSATVYIAEVDSNGNLIQNEREFGYNIRVVNGTAKFTQNNTEASAVVFNSVYGTSSAEDWESIFDENEDLYGDDYEVGENGDFSVDTGDTTPIAGCAAVMAASLLIFALSYRRRHRAR